MFENGDFSLQFGLNCPHISNKNGQWKCIFSKTLSREKIFKTPFAVLWDLSDGWKWRLLETIMSPCWILVNQCTLPLRVCGTVFNHYCFFVWMRKKDLKMQHAYQSRFFLENKHWNQNGFFSSKSLVFTTRIPWSYYSLFWCRM